MSSKIVHAAVALGALASLFTAGQAFADPPPCNGIMALAAGGASYSSTPAPTPVYITGSSALKPLVAALAPAIFASSTRPATIIYLSQGSCVGVQSITDGTYLPTTDTTKTPPAPLASYWDPNSTQVANATQTLKEQTCEIQPNTSVDIGASDVFAASCGRDIQNLTNIADFQGPIQSMTFAVNQNSTENIIDYQSAYLTFGLHKVAPWTAFDHIFRRNASSGTQAMIGAAIGLDPNNWTGKDEGSSANVYNALINLQTQDDWNKGIGILSADYGAKPNVRILGYQHKGQRCAYTPDILPGDKANTREGRYAIWGPIHLLTQIDSSGFAKNLQARDFISYVLGSTPPPAGIDLIHLANQLDLVPPCAMKVQRKSEMGPILPFTPAPSCNCAYDKAATGATSCKVCTSNSDCTGTQSCNFGYCE